MVEAAHRVEVIAQKVADVRLVGDVGVRDVNKSARAKCLDVGAADVARNKIVSAGSRHCAGEGGEVGARFA